MASAFMRELLRYTRNQGLLINPKRTHFYSSQSPSDYSFKDSILNLLHKCHNLTRFYQIQTRFVTSGLLQNPSIAGRILKLSLTFCDIHYTLLLFKCIEFPDTYCVNTVIKGYCCSLPHKVVNFYCEMVRDDGVLFKPNSFTFPPLISVCGKSGDLLLGQEWHGQAVKVFDEMSVRDLVSWNSMVDGYVKVGDMGSAHELFDRMPERNVVSWNVLMKGYLDGKNPGLVLKLFRTMVRTGVIWNDTTVVSVVTACGRSCRLKEGRSVHGSLIRMSVNASLIIGTALIDMYSKCGIPDVAQVIFNRMLVKNLVCWNAMISGQSIYGNAKHGLRLFDKMVERGKFIPDEASYVGVLCGCARLGLLADAKNHFLEMTNVFNVKPNFAHYWCMANLYASHGLVDDAIKFLKNMPVDVNMSPQSSTWAGLLGSCRFNGNMTVGERIAEALIKDDPLNHSYHVLLIVIYAVAGRWEDVSRMKCLMMERGFSVPGFSLVELTQIVNGLEVGDKWEDSISKLYEHG
ncbi:putative tetratricopeptide-like helical domain superfamily [Helianthus annuus]|uniref:Tetratricopeptide-like helical domain superfamily n=1 Tax=Helianthus annuus TaxID=4232 RepID=A0A9K3H3D5_HELAN|nr:putative tetratricopeptide-like helical domain superfamily [Helianthus annuus]KAJ0832576.1 putative tetratricopeptide-like helical domain superfamily [Helianthus annuus]